MSSLPAARKAFKECDTEGWEGLTLPMSWATVFSNAVAFPVSAERETQSDGWKSRSIRVPPVGNASPLHGRVPEAKSSERSNRCGVNVGQQKNNRDPQAARGPLLIIVTKNFCNAPTILFIRARISTTLVPRQFMAATTLDSHQSRKSEDYRHQRREWCDNRLALESALRHQLPGIILDRGLAFPRSAHFSGDRIHP